MNSSTPPENDWMARYKVAIVTSVILMIAAALLVSVFYTPAGEGFNRDHEPDLFFALDDWIDFQSEEHGFSVELPYEPLIDDDIEQLMAEQPEITQYYVEAPGEELVVQHLKYPESIDTSIPELILGGAIEAGMMEVEGAELQEFEYINYQDHPAVEFTAESRQEAVRLEGLYILVGDELYSLLYVTDHASEAISEHFFESFQLER